MNTRETVVHDNQFKVRTNYVQHLRTRSTVNLQFACTVLFYILKKNQIHFPGSLLAVKI